MTHNYGSNDCRFDMLLGVRWAILGINERGIAPPIEAAAVIPQNLLLLALLLGSAKGPTATAAQSLCLAIAAQDEESKH